MLSRRYRNSAFLLLSMVSLGKKKVPLPFASPTKVGRGVERLHGRSHGREPPSDFVLLQLVNVQSGCRLDALPLLCLFNVEHGVVRV